MAVVVAASEIRLLSLFQSSWQLDIARSRSSCVCSSFLLSCSFSNLRLASVILPASLALARCPNQTFLSDKKARNFLASLSFGCKGVFRVCVCVYMRLSKCSIVSVVWLVVFVFVLVYVRLVALVGAK